MSVADADCNGICLTARDIGLPGLAIAYAHPDCDAHSTPSPETKESETK